MFLIAPWPAPKNASPDAGRTTPLVDLPLPIAEIIKADAIAAAGRRGRIYDGLFSHPSCGPADSGYNREGFEGGEQPGCFHGSFRRES